MFPILRPLTAFATSARLRQSTFARTAHKRPFHSSWSSFAQSAMATKYITPDELAAIIKSEKVPAKDYFIVDVRDDDWRGGNIKGSQNTPSSEFYAKVDALVEQTKDVPMVIFHCALSQVRGPKAARIYAQTRLIRLGENEEETEDKPHEVYVLRGGFSDFQAKFKDDPELVENWEKDVWGAKWS
ncbi:hypothetical protein QCA50_006951 [Cerrena zonata]|uniref:Rhodanese domain-containing protein n=1 Tax=Cerrena zonata TaxID=2478898 RepID=A0AAW0GKY0_9APHY